MNRTLFTLLRTQQNKKNKRGKEHTQTQYTKTHILKDTQLKSLKIVQQQTK